MAGEMTFYSIHFTIYICNYETLFPLSGSYNMGPPAQNRKSMPWLNSSEEMLPKQVLDEKEQLADARQQTITVSQSLSYYLKLPEKPSHLTLFE